MKSSESAHAASEKPTRLMSLDVLRGLDMFWIIGGSLLIFKLAECTDWDIFHWLASQMRHPQWHGFTFFDLIFPLFIFLAGVSLPFSIQSKRRKGFSNTKISWQIIKRTLLLILLGILFNGPVRFELDQIRIASVLSRIGIATGVAGLLYVWCKPKALWFIGISLLISYGLLLSFGSAPGYETGDLTMQGNIVSYLDRYLTPGKLLYPNVHDPEGLMTNWPATVNALFGILAGIWLSNPDFGHKRRFLQMLGSGLVLLTLGLIWQFQLPLNKNLWTSSFVLVTSGLSFGLMAIFYGLIDWAGWQKWAFPFQLIGINSILIYMTAAGEHFNFQQLNHYLFGGLSRLLPEGFHGLFLATTLILLELALLWYCQRKKIFLKV